MYRYEMLDPRNTPAAAEANDKVFAGRVYGVEVTVAALAERCTFNLDPQHAGGDASLAAIEAAVGAKLPDEGATLVTIRADLDAVGAMAVFSIRARGESLEPVMERLGLVAEADKFTRGGYPGPRPVPTQENPWDDGSEVRALAAIAAAIADFRVPLADRVGSMERWLVTGEEPASYRSVVEAERLDLINALETGQIKVETHAGGRIAVVESAHRAATSVGYCLAPVVIALNPCFKQGPGEAYRKFTVCAFEARFADIRKALLELNELEQGWGGSPTIGGSPQGVSSTLTTKQVVGVVERHLR